MEEKTQTVPKKADAPAAKAEEKKAAAPAAASEKKPVAVADKKEVAKPTPAKPAETKAAKTAEPKAKADEKKREIVLERVCVVNLTGVYNKTKDKRLARAVKLVREYAARHAKAPLSKVRLATNVNEQIRTHGSSWVQKKIKIRLTKDKEGAVLAELSK